MLAKPPSASTNLAFALPQHLETLVVVYETATGNDLQKLIMEGIFLWSKMAN